MLLVLKLPSFNTVLHNAKVTFCTSSHSVDNRIVHASMQSIVVLSFFVVVFCSYFISMDLSGLKINFI